MSVYRPKRRDGSSKSPFWHYDFQIKVAGESRRFHGSTGQKTKRKAEKVEDRLRYLAATGELTSDMTLALACHRYFDEVSALQPTSDDTATALAHCCRLIGGTKLLVEITAADIADAVRRRSAECVPVRRKRPLAPGEESPPRKLVSPATVNRQITSPMKRVLRRAAKVWDIPVRPDKIDWAALKLQEAGPRKREFVGDETERFWQAIRSDYWPLVRFYLITGLRLRAAIGLQKEHVDLPNKRMHVRLKSRQPGGRWKWMPLSDEAVAILATEIPKWDGSEVWSYLIQRGEKKGERAAITAAGFRHAFDNALREAGITNFRKHDLRHDFACKLLRTTRDLPLVKEALGHADITSTMVYVDVLDETIRDGLNRLARNPGIVPEMKAATAGRRTKKRRKSDG